MGGLVIDIYLEFIFRVIARFFRARGAKSWPVVKAQVTGTYCDPGGFGCVVANVAYEYRLEGELYTGTDAKPFVSDGSAKDYLKSHPQGSELLIRVKPGSPDFSIVRQDDLYRQEHGYLATR